MTRYTNVIKKIKKEHITWPPQHSRLIVSAFMLSSTICHESRRTSPGHSCTVTGHVSAMPPKETLDQVLLTCSLLHIMDYFGRRNARPSESTTVCSLIPMNIGGHLSVNNARSFRWVLTTRWQWGVDLWPMRGRSVGQHQAKRTLRHLQASWFRSTNQYEVWYHLQTLPSQRPRTTELVGQLRVIRVDTEHTNSESVKVYRRAYRVLNKICLRYRVSQRQWDRRRPDFALRCHSHWNCSCKKLEPWITPVPVPALVLSMALASYINSLLAERDVSLLHQFILTVTMPDSP